MYMSLSMRAGCVGLPASEWPCMNRRIGVYVSLSVGVYMKKMKESVHACENGCRSRMRAYTTKALASVSEHVCTCF